MPKPLFNVLELYAPDYNQEDLEDVFEIPNFYNEFEFVDSETASFRVRHLKDGDGDDIDVVVVWRDRAEPTDDEIRSEIALEDEDED